VWDKCWDTQAVASRNCRSPFAVAGASRSQLGSQLGRKRSLPTAFGRNCSEVLGIGSLVCRKSVASGSQHNLSNSRFPGVEPSKARHHQEAFCNLTHHLWYSWVFIPSGLCLSRIPILQKQACLKVLDVQYSPREISRTAIGIQIRSL